MKQLFSHSNIVEIQLRALFLQQHGVVVQIRNEHTSTAMGKLPLSVLQPELWVHDDDLRHAQHLLEEYDHLPPQHEEEWQCMVCGEDNFASFELCWQCQEPRVAE